MYQVLSKNMIELEIVPYLPERKRGFKPKVPLYEDGSEKPAAFARTCNEQPDLRERPKTLIYRRGCYCYLLNVVLRF